MPENLLTTVHEQLLSVRVHEGMDRLCHGLRGLRSEMNPDEWDHFSRTVCIDHPLTKLLHQDPFTARAFEKPWGYAGDAQLLDYIYEGPARSLLGGVSELGGGVAGYTLEAPSCRAVRERRAILAKYIREASQQAGNARIFSLACGFLREAGDAAVLKEGGSSFNAAVTIATSPPYLSANGDGSASSCTGP